MQHVYMMPSKAHWSTVRPTSLHTRVVTSIAAQLSLAAREVMLADQLWYLITLDEKRGKAELTDSERERFVSTAREIEKYRGTNEAIEDLLDKLFAEIE